MEQGINCDFIEIAGETRTNLTIIDMKRHKTTRILEPGPWVPKKEYGRLFDLYLMLLKKASYVVISGSNASGIPDGFCSDLICAAKKQNKYVVLDTSGQSLRQGIRAMPSLIKPNVHEAEFVLGQNLGSAAKALSGLKKILKIGIEDVIISRGDKGVIASDGKEIILAEPPRFKIVNPVGSGDSLVAGYLYARLKRMPFCDMIRFAVAAGAANVLSVQPANFKKSMVFYLFKKIKMKRLQ